MKKFFEVHRDELKNYFKRIQEFERFVKKDAKISVELIRDLFTCRNTAKLPNVFKTDIDQFIKDLFVNSPQNFHDCVPDIPKENKKQIKELVKNDARFQFMNDKKYTNFKDFLKN